MIWLLIGAIFYILLISVCSYGGYFGTTIDSHSHKKSLDIYECTVNYLGGSKQEIYIASKHGLHRKSDLQEIIGPERYAFNRGKYTWQEAQREEDARADIVERLKSDSPTGTPFRDNGDNDE